MAAGASSSSAVLEETKQAWERAYLSEPASRPESALELVADLFTEGDVEREAPPVVGVTQDRLNTLNSASH